MRSQLQPRMRIREAEDGRLAASGGGFLASRRSSVESDSAGRRVGSAAHDVREPPLEAPEPPSFEAPAAPLELPAATRLARLMTSSRRSGAAVAGIRAERPSPSTLIMDVFCSTMDTMTCGSIARFLRAVTMASCTSTWVRPRARMEPA